MQWHKVLAVAVVAVGLASCAVYPPEHYGFSVEPPYTLDAGDSIVFDSSRPHRYRTIGEEEVHLVSVVTQPGAAAEPLAADEFSRRRASPPKDSLRHAS